MKIERNYGYCETCKGGIFPIDEELGLGEGLWSERLRAQIVNLTINLDYREAVEQYKNLVGIKLPVSTAWTYTQKAGSQLYTEQMEEAERLSELPKKQSILPGEPLEKTKIGVGLDGVMLNIIDEGWREAKIGCVFEYEVETEGEEEVVKSKPIGYVGYLGGPEPVGKLLSSAATKHGFDQAEQRVILGDGAPWIWIQSALHFPTGTEVLDWYHAVQHLWRVGHLCFPDDSLAGKCKSWVKSRELELWQGQIETIAITIEGLADKLENEEDKNSLKTEANYFRTHRHRMQYQEFAEEGHPVGSGIVESACKQLVSTRMRGAGMRWSPSGAQHMLALRADYLTKRQTH